MMTFTESRQRVEKSAPAGFSQMTGPYRPRKRTFSPRQFLAAEDASDPPARGGGARPWQVLSRRRGRPRALIVPENAAEGESRGPLVDVIRPGTSRSRTPSQSGDLHILFEDECSS